MYDSINKEKLITLNKIYSTTHNSPYSYNGIYVPRVTEIISVLNKEYLIKWANDLGFAKVRYTDLLNTAAEKGTFTHNKIQAYLSNTPVTVSPSIPSVQIAVNNAFKSFISWYTPLMDFLQPTMIEEKIVCPWFGGTVDTVFHDTRQDKFYLCDYKTSNNVGYEYFLQLAAYKYILENYYNKKINGCFILHLSKKYVKFDEYMINFDNTEHLNFINSCTEFFISLLYSYYYKNNIELEFNNIFRKEKPINGR